MNTIMGNYIGLNAAGTAAIPNVHGISVGHPSDLTREAAGNEIGGTTADRRNIISGNNTAGLRVAGRAVDNQIIGNYIGTTPSGDAALANGVGVLLQIDGATIGGTQGTSPGSSCTGACNLISGNSTGVHFTGSGSTGNAVLGNFIGTNANGDAPLPNNFFGVRFDNEAQDNTLGGLTPEEANVIAGNGTGVRIGDPATTSNMIQGNYIGTNAAGATDLGNANEGVYISNASGNTIGGVDDGAGNVIAYNGADNPDASGVRVQDADALMNNIWGNSIHHNAALGIQLDAGGNNDQPPPTLTSAVNGSTRIEGTAAGPPNSTLRIEFFTNGECDDSGAGEGETFIGSTNVQTNGVGLAAIDVTFTATAAAGEQITATSTDPMGNTSEFSVCEEVTGSATPSPTPTPSVTPTPTPTPSVTPTPTPTPTGQAATPTPTPTPTGQTPTPTPTPTPTDEPDGLQGDNDCDGDSDAVDALVSLQFNAGLPYNQEENCVELGDAVPAGADAHIFGDIDCDGDVDAVDSLQILRNAAGLPVNQEQGCPQIGQPL
jgi:hypothetical protein